MIVFGLRARPKGGEDDFSHLRHVVVVGYGYVQTGSFQWTGLDWTGLESGGSENRREGKVAAAARRG